MAETSLFSHTKPKVGHGETGGCHGDSGAARTGSGSDDGAGPDKGITGNRGAHGSRGTFNRPTGATSARQTRDTRQGSHLQLLRGRSDHDVIVINRSYTYSFLFQATRLTAFCKRSAQRRPRDHPGPAHQRMTIYIIDWLHQAVVSATIWERSSFSDRSTGLQHHVRQRS